MDPVWLSAFAVACLLFMSAFFSGSETALTAVSRALMHRRASEGDKGAGVVFRLTEDKERLIGAILVGNNIVNILATALATSVLTALFGDGGVAFATVGMTLLVLLFGEITPKSFAIADPARASILVARPLALIVRVFAPVVSVMRVAVRAILWPFGVRTDTGTKILAYEEIRGAIDLGHSEGAVERDERYRLLAALDLGNREVGEVMRHRRNIETISVDEGPEAILSFCLHSAHTRIPLYRGEPENIVGVIHAKDLLRAVHALTREGGVDAIAKLDVLDVAMDPWFIPDTTPLDEQMREFLKRRTHFALVVDEYGALQGLITLEDILEEIVGEIADEHDLVAEGVLPEPDGSVIVEGSMTVRDLNRLCDWHLPDEVANTVAGLVIHEAQTIPTSGQVFRFHDFRFEVLERKRHQITKLRVRPLKGGAPWRTQPEAATAG